MIPRPALIRIAQAEQRRQVDERRRQIATLADPAAIERATAAMHRDDRAWAHIVLWLRDPIQLPPAADQPWIWRRLTATSRLIRDHWAREADQPSAHPNAAHWAGIFQIERMIAARWLYIAPIAADRPRLAA